MDNESQQAGSSHARVSAVETPCDRENQLLTHELLLMIILLFFFFLFFLEGGGPSVVAKKKIYFAHLVVKNFDFHFSSDDATLRPDTELSQSDSSLLLTYSPPSSRIEEGS